ncbi:DNA polymerase III subunit psi [Enterobacteriaceae bacterium LUAb1]
MMSRRDELLQQMGIVQYQLRRPGALRGEVIISVPTGVKLLVVTATPPDEDDVLFADILRALRLTRPDISLITPEQWAMLREVPPCPHWWLGNAPEADGTILTSPEFTQLHHSAAARRALWQQICHYESDLFTYGR